MWLRIFRLVTAMLVAWSMALAVCHLFQLGPRTEYDAAEWRLTQSMYSMFGPPWGAVVEGGAWVSAAILTFLLRRRGRVFWWTLVCAVAMILAQVLWWWLVRPVNEIMVEWTSVASMPTDWQALRAQWEYTHALRALVQTVGLAALITSLLVEVDVEVDRVGSSTPG